MGRKLFIAVVAAFGMVGSAVQAAPGRSSAPVPGTACSVFPANDVWNMDVSGLPVSPNSKMWKRSAHAGTTLLHPDFGPPNYGIPYDVVDGSTHSFTSVNDKV